MLRLRLYGYNVMAPQFLANDIQIFVEIEEDVPILKTPTVFRLTGTIHAKIGIVTSIPEGEEEVSLQSAENRGRGLTATTRP
ncbi:MAG: hypothetical protein LQ337_000432 [Flavoplaca oasis]|nr:MAG: hypothetical protein LQ337_000432 [Flavoplaca oasis]